MTSATTARRKRWVAIFAVALFAILAVVDVVHDFVTNDPVHYFAEQPRRLLLVAAIAIIGGPIVLVFDRLSPGLKRRVKLFTLGSAASCLTVFTGYFLFGMVQFLSLLGPSDGRWAFILVPLCLGLVVVWLWWEFFQLLKKRVL